jgi:hypothetical protein
MTVTVILNDMTTITPSFDPEHREAVLSFYQEQFENGLITGWSVS